MTFMLILMFEVSVLAGIGLLAVLVFARKPAAERHRLLAGAVLCAALTPLLNVVLPSWDVPLEGWLSSRFSVEDAFPAVPSSVPATEPAPVPVERNAEAHDAVTGTASVPPARPMATTSSTGASGAFLAPEAAGGPFLREPVAWSTALMALWFAGASLGLTAVAAGMSRLAWIGWKSRPVIDVRWTRIAEEVARGYGLRRRPMLVRNRRPNVLAAWGALRPIVLLPESSVAWDDARIRVVLSHEFAHVRRGDWPVQMVAEMIRAVYWINPLVWMLSSRLRQESEHACDDTVLSTGIAAGDYARQLLAVARTLNPPTPGWAAALMMARKSTLERRFRSILDPRRNHSIRMQRSTAVLLALFLGVTAVQAVLAKTGAAEPLGEPGMEVAPISPTREAGSAVAGATPAQQQVLSNNATSAEATASIEGIVVKAGTSEGLSGANVELTPLFAAGGRAAPPKLLVSGPDGKFAFADLPEGGYRLVADVPLSEYHPAEYGQKTPRSRGAVLRLAASERMQNVRIEMTRTGAVAGRITDARGEPVARARVVAMEMTYRDGRPALNILQAVQTDDLGQYRLFWLSPGVYYIGARTGDITRRTILVQMTAPGRTGTFEEVSSPVIRHRTASDGSAFEETDRMVYYGNTLDPVQSVSIDVPSGVTREGIDVSLASGVARAHRVRGVVVGVAGSPSSQPVSIRLIPGNWTPDAIIPNAATDSQGNFEIPGAVSGAYTLYASGPAPSGLLTGRLTIVLGDTDIDGVKVTIAPGKAVTGRVAVDGEAGNLQLSALRVSLSRDPDLLGLAQPSAVAGSRGPGGAGGAVAADGSFSLSPVGVGDYRLNITGLPRGAYVRSARTDGEDLLATGVHVDAAEIGPIDIRLGTDAGRVLGSAVDERGEPVYNAVMVLVPDASLRRQKILLKTAATDTRGRFTFEDVPPGTYRLLGWDHIAEGAWESEALLRTAESFGRFINVAARSTASIAGLTVRRP